MDNLEQRFILVILILLTYITQSISQKILTSTFPFKATLFVDKPDFQELIELDNIYLYQSLIVTLSISTEILMSGIRPCLVLADKKMPTVYDIMKFLDSENVKDKVDLDFTDNYYIDIEGCSMQDQIQYIQIDPPLSQNLYQLSIYDLSLSTQQFNVDISIDYLYLQDNQLCPDACSYFRYKEESNVCLQGVCNCSSNYIGQRCQTYVFPITDEGDKIVVNLSPLEWSSYKMDLKEIKDLYTLNIIQLHSPANISIIKIGYSDIEVPNFYHDIYNLPQSFDQNYQIGDELLKPYETFAENYKITKLALVISFYNPNVKPISFSFRITSGKFNDDSSNTVLQNVLVIVICIIGVICLIPFIYICVSSLTKKNEQVQVNNLDPNAQILQPTNLIQQGAIRMQQRCTSISKEITDKYMPVTCYTDLIVKYPILKEINECVICLTEFDETSICRMTVCFHLFHKDCLEGWFKLHDNCPFCRKLLTQKAIEESKDKDVNNSYVHRITHSHVSDQKHATERLQEIDSPKLSGVRSRAMSTDESTHISSSENILKQQQIQKRSRFANALGNDQIDSIIQDQDQSRQNQQINILDLNKNDDNNNNNICDDFNNDLHSARRFRSESAQIGQAQGDLAITGNILNLPSLNIPIRVSHNIQNILRGQNSIQRENNNKEEESSKNNESDEIQFSSDASHQNQLQGNNQIHLPDRLINLEDDYSHSEQSQNNFELQNERSPLSFQRNKYNSHDFNPSNKKRAGSNAQKKRKNQLFQQPVQISKIHRDQQGQGMLDSGGSLFSQECQSQSLNNQGLQKDGLKLEMVQHI